MDTPPDPPSDGLPDGYGDERSGLKSRFEHALRGLEKPKSGLSRRPLKPLKSEEKRERLHLVSQCVKLGMSVEQMADFLPTWDLPLSRSTIYEYLGQLKLPRSY